VNYSFLINQLKLLTPIFNGNVAGAAAYAHGVEDQVWLPMPAAYVVPLEEEAGEQTNMNSFLQVITERFQVIVVFDNTNDRRGQSVTEQYECVRLAIFSALLNWRPDAVQDNPGLVLSLYNPVNRSSKGIYSQGAGLMSMDRARLFYQWTFALDCTFTEADGWQQPSVPLTSIDVNEAEFGSFQVIISQ
jgi:hypothetical protein